MRQIFTQFPTPAGEIPDNPLEAGDFYLDLAIRCYAAGMLSDREIVDRIVKNLASLDREGQP